MATAGYSEEHEIIITDRFNDLLSSCSKIVKKEEDWELIRKAFFLAKEAHKGVLRRSGEPYILHPLAVAKIVVEEIGLGVKSVAAALLHDVVEDTAYTVEEIDTIFGEKIAYMVDGLTKMAGDTSKQAAYFRKVLLTLSDDVRVILIKIADRLHNMRTMASMPRDKQVKISSETLYLFAPLAYRLGLYAIKTELEELSFKVLYPKIYNEIVVLVARRAGQRDVYLKQILAEINEDLDEQHIKAYVTGRPKDYFSIYQKMIVRGHDFANIYDLVGVRIIVDTIQDCYAALGAVHARWNPVPGRFKDYIAMPKLNMYQSLHTTVVGPGGKPVEIQIRTWDMHRRAEFGIAAHWKYKENGQAGRALSSPDKSDRKRGENQELSEADNLKWIQQLADWTSETPDSDEFLGSLKEDLGAAEVYVFTPKGKIVSLPAEATPIDFAYAVHTEVGHRTMGARVNGRLVPLDTKLENGDTVEILTSKSESAGPSRDWLSFAKSPKARNKIRQWFSKERRTEAVEEGRDELTRAMRKRNLPITTLLTPEALVGVADELNLANAEAVFVAIGDGQISTQNVISHLVRDAGSDEVDEEVEQEALPLKQVERTKKTTSSLGISVKGVGDIWVKLARCCMPVPGDKIIGFITRNQGVSVHRVDCQNMLELEKRQPERVVDVQWTSTKGVFMVKIQVEALDRPHLLSDVTRVLSDHGVNIISGSISTGTDRVATSQFSFEMADPQHLNTLLAAVRKIEGVFDVYRITGAKDSAEPRLRKM